jgi:hypothetical protein
MVRPLIACIPDLPPRTVHYCSQIRVLEHDAAVIAPWASEIRRSGAERDARFRGHGHAVQDIVARIRVRIATVGGDVSLTGDGDGAFFEPGDGCLAEDEISCAFDVAFVVYLCAGVGEHGVLVADEFTAIVALGATVGGEGDGLDAGTAGVDHVEVVDVDVRRLYTKGAGGVVISCLVGAFGVRYCYLVLGIVLVVGGVAIY